MPGTLTVVICGWAYAFALFAALSGHPAEASTSPARAGGEPARTCGEPARVGGEPTSGSALLARVTPLLPYGTVMVAAVLPLAAVLYLVTTAAWTVVERVVLR